MLRSLAALLLVCSSLHAQAWTPIAAPTKPMVAGFDLDQSQICNHTWLYPFNQPTPAGTYKISNCIVSRNQTLGAFSEECTLTTQSGWYLYGHSWNQPVSSDDAGIVWKVKVVTSTPQFDYTPFFPGSEHYFYVGWGGTYPDNQIAPYSYTLPRLQELKQDARRVFRMNMFTAGTGNQTVAPAPVCLASSLPYVPMEICYTRVGETGETQPSPSYIFTPPTPHDGWTVAQTCELGFGIQEQHPQGTLGYYVYVKLQGGVWQRVPAAHCFGTPTTVDDWLWQWHDRQPTIRRLVPNAPTLSLARGAQSRLNSLQLALKNTNGNVVVGANAVINTTCPIIDEWDIGPFPYNAPSFGRRICSADGGKWSIVQQQSYSGHKYWPVLAIENSYSTWVGAEVQANGGSAAVSFGDFSGGQAFGNRFIDCNFYTKPSATGIVCGLLIDAKSTGQYGSHVASETKLYNVKANGDICFWIGGQQAANFRANETNITCTGSGRQFSAVYLECPNQVTFVNGFNVDARYAGAVFRASSFNAKLLGDGIWADQEFSCLAEGCGISFDVKLSTGKLNVRGTSPVLARLIDTHSLSNLIFSDIDVQPDPGVTAINVISGSYNLAGLRFTDTYLSELTVLREPTKDQTTALLRVIMYDPSMNAVDVPVPGMKLTVPSVSPPGVALVTTVSDQSIVFNSLTGRQQVRRVNWTD